MGMCKEVSGPGGWWRRDYSCDDGAYGLRLSDKVGSEKRELQVLQN